jgi:hypothetical protein
LFVECTDLYFSMHSGPIPRPRDISSVSPLPQRQQRSADLANTASGLSMQGKRT